MFLCPMAKNNELSNAKLSAPGASLCSRRIKNVSMHAQRNEMKSSFCVPNRMIWRAPQHRIYLLRLGFEARVIFAVVPRVENKGFVCIWSSFFTDAELLLVLSVY